MLKIAIIDSGIDHSHPKLHKAKISQYRVGKVKNKLTIISEFPIDKLGHGTACAGIIHKHASNAEIISLRIFDESLKAPEELLVFLLQYCIDISVDIINCSIGIEKKASSKLYEICKKAYEKNIFIVAACSNELNRETYPAFFPFVFGVTSGMLKSREWGYISSGCIKYIAKGTLQRVLSLNEQYNITGGTSLACPHLTAIIANFIQENVGLSIDDVHSFLRLHAKSNIFPIQLVSYNNKIEKECNKLSYVFPKDLHFFERFSQMRKIAVFPATDKEIDSIIKFENLIKPFELHYIIDYPKSIRREKHTQNIHYGISNIDFQSFDTLIIGYFYNQLFERNIHCGYELILSCLKNNIHIFCLSPDLYRRVIEMKMKVSSKSIIYTPHVGENEFQSIMNYGHLPEIKCPLLSVIGTGSKQGKLSTQMRIKMILEQAGYITAYIGTEPQSEILGANFCFPIGYKGNVSLTGEKKIKYLRNLVKVVDYYLKPNIIISGIQGWTLTRSIHSEADETAMVNFLYGIQPDALICTISPEDTIETIEKNVQAAMLFTQSKCIFYALSPYRRTYQNGATLSSQLNDCEYKDALLYFSQKLKANVFDIFDDSNKNLILKLIMDYFS